MSDLRDGIHPPELTPAQKVFLEYHDNSPWALAKVKAGVHLFPESVAYMQRELDERARYRVEREKNLKEESTNAQQPAETPAAEAATGRGPAADAVGGLPGSDTETA